MSSSTMPPQSLSSSSWSSRGKEKKEEEEEEEELFPCKLNHPAWAAPWLLYRVHTLELWSVETEERIPQLSTYVYMCI